MSVSHISSVSLNQFTDQHRRLTIFRPIATSALVLYKTAFWHASDIKDNKTRAKRNNRYKSSRRKLDAHVESHTIMSKSGVPLRLWFMKNVMHNGTMHSPAKLIILPFLYFSYVHIRCFQKQEFLSFFLLY